MYLNELYNQVSKNFLTLVVCLNYPIYLPSTGFGERNDILRRTLTIFSEYWEFSVYGESLNRFLRLLILFELSTRGWTFAVFEGV